MDTSCSNDSFVRRTALVGQSRVSVSRTAHHKPACWDKNQFQFDAVAEVEGELLGYAERIGCLSLSPDRAFDISRPGRRHVRRSQGRSENSHECKEPHVAYSNSGPMNHLLLQETDCDECS